MSRHLIDWTYETKRWEQTEWRVTFRSGIVTRHGTMKCVVERVMKMVSRLSLGPPLMRKGCTGSGCRQKHGGNGFKCNLDSSWGNGSYYWSNFVNKHADLPRPDNVPPYRGLYREVIMITSGAVCLHPAHRT